MDTHKNARLTPKGREEMVRAVVESGLSTLHRLQTALFHHARVRSRWKNNPRFNLDCFGVLGFFVPFYAIAFLMNVS
jgi:hypothetical protein